MSYTHTQLAPVLRLGLRARWSAAREARLVSTRSRRLAEDLEKVVARANTPRWPLTAVVPVSTEASRGARGALLDLAERLRRPRPVTLEGMCQVRHLLVDGAGPLYVTGEPGELHGAALRAPWALDRSGATG